MTDSYREGAARNDGRLFGRFGLFRSEGEDTLRSAVGRAALESVFAPSSLLAGAGVNWRAQADDLIVGSWTVPPETVELHVRIDERGALRSAMLQRWATPGISPIGTSRAAGRSPQGSASAIWSYPAA